MGKGMKIVRNKGIYRSSRRPLRIVLGLVAVGVLFAAGWFLYQPAYNWVMGLDLLKHKAPAAESQVQQQSAAAAPAEESGGAEAQRSALAAVWVPAATVSNESVWNSYLSKLPQGTVNTVILELKDQKGTVLYKSGVETVAAANAQAADAYDLKTVVDQLHQAGYTVLGRLYAFQDSTAGTTLKDGLVHYKNTDYAWIDNSLDKGGKTWLNPYSQQAQSYISELMEEALDMGVDGFVLDGVQFPSGVGLDLADYGATGDQTRPQVLSRLLQSAADLVKARGGVGCWAYFDASEFLSPDTNTDYGPYGGSIGTVAADAALMVNVAPASFGTGTEAGVSLKAPITQPGPTVTAVLEALHLGGDRSRLMPVLQAYTDGSIAAEFNLDYGWDQVSQQIEAAKAYGARDMAFYDPAGAYTALHK